MAINPVSGNLQPLPVANSGTSLPQPEESKLSPNAREVQQEKSIVEQQPINNNKKLSSKLSLEEQKEQVDEDKLLELASFAQKIERRLTFKVDQDTGKTVVKVFDRDTDKLIRQFPPEELLTLTKRLKLLSEQDSEKSGVFLRKEV